MPSTNTKGPINVPPGIDSKNPAKYTGMGNFDFGELLKDPLGLGSLNKVVSSTDNRGHLSANAVTHGFTDKFGKLDANAVISSGGKGKTENIPQSDNLAGSLYGTNRFNKLWNLYNDVKGQKDIASNPKYQRLLNKLVRKMPKTLRNLERNVEKTERKRNEMSKKLGFNSTVSSNEEIVSNARDRVETFLNNPTPEYVPKDTNIKNESKDGITGVDIVDQKYSAGENLGSRLGSDISAALKNKKW